MIRAGAGLLVAVVALVGCGGGDSSEPIVEPPLTEVGTESEETARQPVIRDVTAIRTAIEGGEIDEAMTSVYALLNRAGEEKDIQKSAAMLRRGVPPLADRAERSLPDVRAALARLRLRTATGKKFSEFALFIAIEDVRMLVSFRRGLQTSEYAWDAATEFGELNNALSAEAGRRIERLQREAPADERAALDRAVEEVYGGN